MKKQIGEFSEDLCIKIIKLIGSELTIQNIPEEDHFEFVGEMFENLVISFFHQTFFSQENIKNFCKRITQQAEDFAEGAS